MTDKEVNTALLKALKDAAESLKTISRLAGKSHYIGDDGERFETYMGHHDQVRGYAESRASVAFEAIQACREALAQPEQEPVATVQRINGITIGYLEFSLPVGTKLYTTPQAPAIQQGFQCGNCGEIFTDNYANGVGNLAPVECPKCGEESSIEPKYPNESYRGSK